MKTAQHQIDMNYYPEDMEAFAPVRPDPFVPDRVSVYEIATSDRRPGSDTRDELAASFRNMDRAVQPETAYEQAKDFYRSSGHAWTRGLDR